MTANKKDDVRVEDRRHFDRDGNVIQPKESAGGGESTKAADPAKPKASDQSADQIDFISVLFSYIHTALIYLGDLEDPIAKKTSVNLDGARQMIDILELMQAKTKGNLTQQEGQYLESALYDLRMRYVKKSKP